MEQLLNECVKIFFQTDCAQIVYQLRPHRKSIVAGHMLIQLNFLSKCTTLSPTKESERCDIVSFMPYRCFYAMY